jgi:ketosteroid isomerase-like protein
MLIGELVDRFFTAIEKGDASTLERLYADDVTIWHNFTGRTQAKKEGIASLIKFAEVATSKFSVLERHISGDSIAQRHEIDVVMKTGEAFHIPVAIFMTMKNGQIIRIHEYLDSADVVRGTIDPISDSP